MALKLEERLEQAEKKLAELKALKARADARKKAEDGKEKRRLDNKKKILLGAYLLDRMERDAKSSQKVLEGLDGFLTRPADRAVFGLPAPQPSPTSSASGAPHG
ncbi:mobilization protein [Variovorax sp. J22P271]|uniref:mobilization protein n=1 Tax=Variovorax davisae TaxID=3053515 RepID=UPI002574D86A|nr:mobilization protein [Variovorax sp. J22P271]MDM0037323.1 mobilization protein [Variovorax sp. J22P271]